MKITLLITLFACYQPIACAIRGAQKGTTENTDLLAPLLDKSDYLKALIDSTAVAETTTESTAASDETEGSGSDETAATFLPSEPPPLITAPPPLFPESLNFSAIDEAALKKLLASSKGEKGDQGLQGPPGAKGQSVQGSPGESIKGEKGDVGPLGLQGPPGTCGCELEKSSPNLPISIGGLMGPKGEKGDRGLRGSRGDKGTPGSNPDKGQKGSKGDRGPPGTSSHYNSKVVEGPRGPPGPVGPPGPSGMSQKGEKGDPGELKTMAGADVKVVVGPPGPAGKPGIPGKPGRPGSTGRPGPPGGISNVVPGSVGPPQGCKGQKGDPGNVFGRGPVRDGSYQIVPGAVVFRTVADIFNSFSNFQPGTLAYSTESETLLLRVGHGWREIQLGRLYRSPSAASSERLEVPTDSDSMESTTKYISSLENLESSTSVEIAATLAHLSSEEQRLEVSRESSSILYTAMRLKQKSPLFEYPFADAYQTTTAASTTQSTKRRFEEQQRPLKDDVLHLIALNHPLSGNFNGVRGADFACYHQARAAGFSTTFRAFISSSVQDLDKVVAKHSRIQPDEILFDSWNGIFDTDGKFGQKAEIYSFNGSNVLRDSIWPQKFVWHGSQPTGMRKVDQFCEAWRSNANRHVGLSADLSQGRLLGQEKSSCDQSLVVLCIENMSKKRREIKRFRQKRLFERWLKSRKHY